MKRTGFMTRVYLIGARLGRAPVRVVFSPSFFNAGLIPCVRARVRREAEEVGLFFHVWRLPPLGRKASGLVWDSASCETEEIDDRARGGCASRKCRRAPRENDAFAVDWASVAGALIACSA